MFTRFYNGMFDVNPSKTFSQMVRSEQIQYIKRHRWKFLPWCIAMMAGSIGMLYFSRQH